MSDERIGLRDDRGFEGTKVIKLEVTGPRPWIEAVVNYLRALRPSHAIGVIALVIAGFECHSVDDPLALIVVVAMTLAFAKFIGRPHADELKASIPVDLGTTSEGTGEAGEP
jgi:hypothetical protein